MSKVEEQYERVKQEEEGKKFKDEPLPIAAALKDIDDEKMVIPEFQRDFVWDLDKISLLFDSIYRGYTIGNLLLWITTERLAHKKVGDKDTLPLERVEDKEYTYVLDGQQRLTSLYSILRGKSVYRSGRKKSKIYKIYFDTKNDEFVKFNAKLEEFNNKTLQNIEKEGNLDKFRFIDLSLIFNDKEDFPNKFIDAERKKIETECDACVEREKVFEEFKQKNRELEQKKEILVKFSNILRSYKISQIVDRNTKIDRVVTIFERINTQNVKLDIFDIMVAKTYQNIKFQGNDYTFNLRKAVSKITYNKELEDEYLSPDSVLSDDENLYYWIYNTTLLRQISIYLSAIKDGSIALQKSDIYELKAQNIYDNIAGMRTLINSIHRFCKNQLNINDVDEDLTDNKILSFLSYIFSKKEYVKEDTELLNKWFWNSMIFNRFPGAQLQLIEKDINAYKKGKDYFLDYIRQRRSMLILNKEYKLGELEFLDAGYANINNNLYLSLILLLNSLKPIDFSGKDEVNISEYVGVATKNNKHHIIPNNSNAAKTLRTKHGKKLADFMINNIANIAIISSELNKHISGKDPKDYFKEYEKLPNFNEILDKHLITEEMYQDLCNEKYEEFLKKRTEKIINSIISKCKINDEKLIIQEEEEDDDN